MGRAIPITVGDRFDRLVVLEQLAERQRRNIMYRCRCDCGNEVTAKGTGLAAGDNKSCGCLAYTRQAEAGRLNRKPIAGGTTFGRLTVVRELPERRLRHWIYLCRCECGTEVEVRGAALRSGDNQSCGCLNRELIGKRMRGTGHGMVGTPTHTSWAGMTQRCRDPNAWNFKYYGGRGITVCERWSGRAGFTTFLADMGERPDGLTLDRIDPDGDYEPSNCRWATPVEQARNKSS